MQAESRTEAAPKPGGCSAPLDFVADEDCVSPPTRAAFALTMLMTTESGDAYTPSERTAMSHEAGFKGVTGHPIPMSPNTVVKGRA